MAVEKSEKADQSCIGCDCSRNYCGAFPDSASGSSFEYLSIDRCGQLAAVFDLYWRGIVSQRSKGNLKVQRNLCRYLCQDADSPAGCICIVLPCISCAV